MSQIPCTSKTACESRGPPCLRARRKSHTARDGCVHSCWCLLLRGPSARYNKPIRHAVSAPGPFVFHNQNQRLFMDCTSSQGNVKVKKQPDGVGCQIRGKFFLPMARMMERHECRARDQGFRVCPQNAVCAWYSHIKRQTALPLSGKCPVTRIRDTNPSRVWIPRGRGLSVQRIYEVRAVRGCLGSVWG